MCKGKADPTGIISSANCTTHDESVCVGQTVAVPCCSFWYVGQMVRERLQRKSVGCVNTGTVVTDVMWT